MLVGDRSWTESSEAKPSPITTYLIQNSILRRLVMIAKPEAEAPPPSVLVDHPSDGVVRITLNRPKALNAISSDLLEGFCNALQEHGNANTRVILLEGAGDRSFCAGEDLKQTLAPRTGSAEELREAFFKLQDITRLTSSASPVVVSAVQGFAIGGGAEIALAADFVVGGPKAKFRFPEVTLGHAATGGITLRLTSMVGLLKAKELLITGRWVEAEEALRIGMLSEIAEDPKARALELAVQLAALPNIAMTASKTSLERVVFPNMEACLHDEVNVASYCFAQSAAAEAFANFAQRKAPALSSAAPQNGGHTEEKGSSVSNGLTGKTDETTTPKEVTPVTNGQSPPAKAPIRDINTALQHAVRNYPDRTFVRFGGHDYTFAQADEQIARLAGGLKAIGLGAGDRLLVMMRNSVEMLYTWMAANRLGAVWVPINVQLKSVSLKNVIQAAGPKFAVVDGEFWPVFQTTDSVDQGSVYINGTSENQVSLRSLSELFEGSFPVKECVQVQPSTTAAFLFTSGTTGRSKPCILSHEYFILQAQALIDGCGLRSDDVLYCPFPLFHADATALTTIPAILLGAVAAISPRFTASRFWDEIRATQATVYDFMGATLALIYKQPPGPGDRDHKVRLAWGVPIPLFAPDYEERFGHRLVTLYGSVEASLPIFQQQDIPLPRGSCGRVRPGHQLRIANEHDEQVPAGTPGQLLLRSDNPNAFFQGYFNDPANTARCWASGWLHTGDIGKVDAEGNVYFMGRVKDVIRRRGENVNAEEVEEEFLQHPDVTTAAAYAIPSQLGAGTEEDVKLAVQTRPGSSVDEKALWQWAVENMARFQVPSVIEIVPEIRKTATGKIEKHGLPVEGGVRFDQRT
jgi:crotonobetaine/carnitine-CoA ligase